jgi:excisionase family DNA binding protein
MKQQPPLPDPNLPRFAYRINDFTKLMGLGRTSVYELIKDGKLKAVRIAGRTLIPASEGDRLIAEARAAALLDETLCATNPKGEEA